MEVWCLFLPLFLLCPNSKSITVPSEKNFPLMTLQVLRQQYHLHCICPLCPKIPQKYFPLGCDQCGPSEGFSCQFQNIRLSPTLHRYRVASRWWTGPTFQPPNNLTTPACDRAESEGRQKEALSVPTALTPAIFGLYSQYLVGGHLPAHAPPSFADLRPSGRGDWVLSESTTLEINVFSFLLNWTIIRGKGPY